ncbi:MAG TPA: RidA family protein [Anaerolineales bacterium]|nr:RidA family protein [Anaerolineales bacterium]
MKTKINPPNFTKTVGAYSQGLKVDIGDKTMIFVSGQLAMDSHGNPVAPDDISAQTRYIFENIRTILMDAGAVLEDVVKVQIFLTDISRFSQVSVVRNEYMENIRPVSTLVEISRTVKEGCDVEIEVIAIMDNKEKRE